MPCPSGGSPDLRRRVQVLAGSEPKIFDWRWDAKRVLKNISESQFKDAIRELEHEAGMISFETEDILQQVDLNFE